MSATSPFTGLGTRIGAMVANPDDLDDDPPVRRIVDAATATPLGTTTAPASVWDIARRPGGASYQPVESADAEPVDDEEPTRPQSGTVRVRLLQLLAADGPARKEAILATLGGVSLTQLNRAIGWALKFQHMEVNGVDHAITDAGRAWLALLHAGETQRTAALSPFNSHDTPPLPPPKASAPPATTEEQSMPKQPAKPARKRATKANAPQFQICSLLLGGDLSRDELLADVSAERNAFSQALFAAKSTDRIVFVEKTDKYHLTKAGKDWVTGGANLAAQKATVPAPEKPTKKPRAEKHTPALPPAATGAAPRTFRCAVDNKGWFNLHKNGVEIELDAQEHEEMLDYLDSMGTPRTRRVPAPA